MFMALSSPLSSGAEPQGDSRSFDANSVADNLLLKSQTSLATKDYVSALKSLDDALKFSPNNARTYLDTAMRDQANGDLREAMRYYMLALEAYPNLENIYATKGFTMTRTMDYYGAIQCFSIALNLQPGDYIVRSSRAQACMYLGSYADAIADFNVHISAGLPDRLYLAYHDRGICRLRLGDKVGASRDLDTAIRLNPRHFTSYVYLAQIKYELGMREAAIELCNRAIALEPKNVLGYNCRSWMTSRSADFSAAIADANQCIHLMPDNPIYILYRALMYDVHGQLDLAKSDYETAISKAEGKKDNDTWYYSNFNMDLLRWRSEQIRHARYLDDVVDWPDVWPKRIGMLLAGRISTESLLRDAQQAARIPEQLRQRCEACYYAGMIQLLSGNEPSGRRLLQECIQTGQIELAEYNLAQSQLQRLDSKAR